MFALALSDTKTQYNQLVHTAEGAVKTCVSYYGSSLWLKRRPNSWGSDACPPFPCDDTAVQYIHIPECRDGRVSNEHGIQIWAQHTRQMGSWW
jgi:hypothetical protein